MKFKRLNKCAGLAGAFLIAVSAGLYGQAVTPQLEMLPESLHGIVLFPDGETPVTELPIRLWSTREKRIIYRSDTDNNGTFRIPRLLTGGSMLFVGRLRVNLNIIEKKGDFIAQQHDMILVVPRTMLVTGGRMFDVLISPVLANAAVMGGRDEGKEKKEKEKEPPEDDEPEPEIPPDPPPVSP